MDGSLAVSPVPSPRPALPVETSRFLPSLPLRRLLSSLAVRDAAASSYPPSPASSPCPPVPSSPSAHVAIAAPLLPFARAAPIAPSPSPPLLRLCRLHRPLLPFHPSPPQAPALEGQIRRRHSSDRDRRSLLSLAASRFLPLTPPSPLSASSAAPYLFLLRRPLDLPPQQPPRHLPYRPSPRALRIHSSSEFPILLNGFFACEAERVRASDRSAAA